MGPKVQSRKIAENRKQFSMLKVTENVCILGVTNKYDKGSLVTGTASVDFSRTSLVKSWTLVT